MLTQAAENRAVVIAVPADQLEHILGVDPQARHAAVVEWATERRRIGIAAEPRPRLVEHAREIRVALEFVSKVPNGSHPRARYRVAPSIGIHRAAPVTNGTASGTGERSGMTPERSALLRYSPAR